MIERLIQDLRYAVRAFRRAPGFLLLTVLTIAIGVGANAAIFSIVNTVLLKPLPFGHPNDLVLVTDSDRRTRQSNGEGVLSSEPAANLRYPLAALRVCSPPGRE